MSQPLEAGVRLGRYRLGSLIGEGGMGRVYRAVDEALHREVAVKVIHAARAGDPSATSRFEREAMAVAALSHPNIVALYDAGTHEGTTYAVMELLDGETLRAKLAGGRLPPRKAVEYGVQIARALAAAHGRGILHRDIKPDNVFVTRESHIKVLDFGLAALNDAASAFEGATRTATTPGVVVGTPGYMAPEQLRSGQVDERTDIFALGATLYEMLSGRRAFSGASQADILSAILHVDPPEIPGTGTVVPLALDRIVRRCLEKNPDDRFDSAHDLAFALEAVGSGTGSNVPVTLDVPRRVALLPLAALIAAITLAAAGFVAGRLSRQETAPELPAARFILPVHAALIADVAISPDGRHLAWTALPTPEQGDASIHLWMRSLDSPEVRGLPNTSTAVNPLFSADGSELWFVGGSAVEAIDVTSGRRRTVMNVPASEPRPGRGFSVNEAGDAIIALESGVTLTRAGTTNAVPLTTVDPSRETSHQWPLFFPDGIRYLYVVHLKDGSREARVASVRGGEHTKMPLPPDVTRVLIDPAGYLIFGRGAALFTQPFDVATLAVRGSPIRLTDAIIAGGPSGWMPMTLSNTGILAYREAPERRFQFEWVSRSGASLGRVGREDAYNNFDLSADGTSVVVARRSLQDGNSLHVLDTVRGSTMMVVNTGRQSTLSDPTWSADGRRIAYRDGGRLVARDVAGGNERVIAAMPVYPDSWSPDGRWLLGGYAHNGRYAIGAVAADGSGTIIPIDHESGVVDEPRFSPDGTWILYHAAPDRRPEIFLQPFPVTGEKIQISIEGGVQPRWRGDGKEFYFIDLTGRLQAVDVAGGNPRQAGRPRVLADLRLSPSTALDQYSPAPDGSKFLVRRPHGTDVESIPLHVMVNWRRMVPELRER